MKLVLSLIAAGLFTGVLACGPYKPEVKPNPLQETEKVLLLDGALTRYLNVVKHKSERVAAGQLQVTLEMQNEEKNSMWADVQVIFRDKDGYELEKTNWEPTQFQGRAVTTLRKNSLSAKAEDYRILIRNIK